MYSETISDNMLGVLIYLFKNNLKSRTDLPIDRERLTNELEKQGFSLDVIHKALDWLNNLDQNSFRNVAFKTQNKQALRIFNQVECQKLTAKARSFIMQVESLGVLTTENRELALAQMLQLDETPVDIDQAKWVVLMVLLEHSDQDNALLCAAHIMRPNNFKDIQ